MQKKKNTLFHKALSILATLVFIPWVISIVLLVIFNDMVFGQYRGWNYNYLIFKQAFRFTFFWSGIRPVTFFETPHNRKQKYIFVLNHISYLDIPVMILGIRQPMRILAKTGPHKVPFFGYYYRKSTVMVDRSSLISRSKSVEALKHYLEKGISIVIFPEGTFNMGHQPLKSFYDGAFRIAIETQTNIKPIIMVDTYERFYYHGLSLEPGKCRVVYLEEVSVQGLTLNDVEALKTKVYRQMEDALQRYQATWIGNDKGNGGNAIAV